MADEEEEVVVVLKVRPEHVEPLVDAIDDALLAAQAKGASPSDLVGALAFVAANHASQQPFPERASVEFVGLMESMLSKMMYEDQCPDCREPSGEASS